MNNKDLLKAIGDIDDNYLCENNKKLKKYSEKFKEVFDMKKKFLNAVAVVVLVLVIGTIAPKVYAMIVWNIEYKEYENRNIIRRMVALDESSRVGYIENIDMDYVYQDGIGIKITSLILTNDYCKIGIDTISENGEIDKDKTFFNYSIYDENNNIYAVLERITGSRKDSTYWKKVYKELGIKADNMNSQLAQTAFGNLSDITMTSIKGFPKSKKLYLRISNIGYINTEFDRESGKVFNIEDVCLSNSEWQFEIDVPEKFYDRAEIELVLSESVDGVIINKAELTETGLEMKISINKFREFLMSGKDMDQDTFNKLRDSAFYISDGDGNIYAPANIGLNEKDEIHARFGIGKDNLDKKIFLNVSLNDIQAKIELIKK